MIKELIIYGYGKFEQYQIQLQHYQLIYGKNEAGKSTMMSFIHSILFGFPLKQQTDLRYEPKTNSKYGGQLVLEMPHWGNVRIERVKGKAAGDVTVYLEDGTRGGEELLQQILGGMDKSTYQSIYSFNIHGLQHVHKLKGAELSKFLFSASAVGTDKIMEAEQLLQKELDKRFKPSGVKPELNVKLNGIKQTERKLNEAKAKVANYETLVASLETTRHQIEEKRKQITLLNEKIDSKKEWNRIYPLLLEKKEIFKELEEIGDVPFPKDGLHKLHQLEIEQESIAKRLPPLLKQRDQIQTELEALEINEDLLSRQDKLQLLIEDLPEYKQNVNHLQTDQLRLEQLESEVASILSKLDYKASVENVENFDLSFARKSEITKLVTKKSQLIQEKIDLEKQEADCQQKINNLESFLQELQTKRLSDEERNHLEALVKEEEEQESLEKELQWITEQTKLFEKNKSSTQKVKNGKKIFFIGFLISLLASLLFFILNFKEIGIALLIPAIVFIFLILYGKQENDDQLYDSILKKKQDIEERLNRSFNSKTIEMAKEKLENDSSIQRQVDMENIRLSSLEQQFENIVHKFENWERDMKLLELELIKIGESYHMTVHMAQNYLLDCFELLEKLREKLFEEKRTVDSLGKWQSKVEERIENLNAFEQFISNRGTDYVEKVIYLKQKLVKQQELAQNQAELQTKLQNIQEQLSSWESEQQILQENIQQLLQEANASSREEFLMFGEKVQKVEKLTNELEPINKQLIRTGIAIPQDLENIQQFVSETTFEEWTKEKSDLQKKIDSLEKEYARIKHEIFLIEEGGTYTELLHTFHREKYELREKAKEWGIYQTALYILQKSMEKYKIERLPKVLQQASKYFSIITDGEYSTIYLEQSEDMLYVKRKDGLIFTPDELSQATGEQLYISIRFALAITMNEKQAFPLIIDDGFVHFDETRVENVMRLIDELASNEQILFFTCHKDYTKYFNKESILMLNS